MQATLAPGSPRTRAADERPLRIGVALATFNGARYLSEQLDSLLAQERRPDVLEVSDDGSTDATLEILEAFALRAPFPVQITRNVRQLGYRENFLATASRLPCDFIAFCDQDDVWRAEKLARIEARLIEARKRSDAAPVLLVIHGGAVTDADGSLRLERYPAIPADAELDPMQLNLEQSFPGFSLCAHESLLRRFDVRDRAADPNEPGIAMAHDQWMVLLGGALGRVVLLQEDLVHYRRHDQTVTAARGERRSTLRQRLALALGTDAALYGHRAAFYLNAAQSLVRAAGAEAAAADVQAAISALEVRASHCQRRAHIHTPDSSFAQRCRALGSLLRRGAYSGPNSLGRSALLKDVAGTVLGSLSRDDVRRRRAAT